MLTVSPAASAAIKDLVAASGLPENAGIRISNGREGAGRLGLTLVPEAEEADAVVEEGGATVFLAEDVAERLGDKTLDLQSEGDEVVFTILDGEAQP